MLDSGIRERPGGTGETFDWEKLREMAAGDEPDGHEARCRRWVDIRRMWRGDREFFKPWGVDVASGVEARPGKKDPEKVRAFVKAVREMDRKAS